MFGKIVLILASLGTLQANYLRGPGNSTALVLKTNMSNALVPYKPQHFHVKSTKKCKINKAYYWNNTLVSST
jgi:hypothetical protein